MAFVATVYGVGLANLFFLPAASKLRTRASDALLVNDMVLEGVTGIVEGLNPTLIRLKLESYYPPPAASAAKPKGNAKEKDVRGGDRRPVAGEAAAVGD